MNDDIKLGLHTLKERNQFVESKTANYLERHPGVNRKKARKYAKVKWARKVKAEIKKTKHVNRMRVAK